jgi:uncharacterized protein (TIRG00374 family)
MRFFLHPWVRTTAKFILAAALLIWMIRSGRLDLSHLSGALTHWPQMLAIVTIYYVTICVMAWRWNLLLGTQNFSLSFQEAFSLTMIGSLFNVVIPGAVGGDIVKGYYVSRRAVARTPEALTTILIDRVVGLLGLLLLAAIAALWNFRVASGNPALEGLCLFAIVSTLAGGLALALAVAMGGRFTGVERWRRNRWVASVWRGMNSLARYKRHPGFLVSAMAASVFSQLLFCVAFHLAVQTLEGPSIPWRYYFLVVPVGLLTTALPISPAGLGVGQAAFFSLFQLIPGGSGTLGADACTVYQLLLVLVYLTGLYSYLTYGQTLRQEAPPLDTGNDCHGTLREVDQGQINENGVPTAPPLA